MTASRQCPKCGEALPESPTGLVDCPRCQHQVLSPLLPDMDLGEAGPLMRVQDLPPPPPPLMPVLLSTERSPGRPPSSAKGREQDWSRCPRCNARVRRSDEHCFLCGVSLHEPEDDEPEDSRSAEPARRDYEPHRGQLIGTLAKISLIAGGLSFTGLIFLPLAAISVLAAASGIGTVVMARDDLELMDRRVMDPAGREATLAGQSNGTVGIVLGIAGALLSLLVKMPTLLA